MEKQMASVINTGKLASGKMWAIIESGKKSLASEQGDHYVLQLPRDSAKPDGEAFAHHEVTEQEDAEAYLIAKRAARRLSEDLGRQGYFRLEANGPAASTRDTLHFHIIGGREGVTFRRCVDPIVI